MRSPRILGFRLLVISLWGFLSCYYGNAQPPPTTNQNCIIDIDTSSCTVKVSQCRVDANNDPWVNLNDTVTWRASTTTTIDFKPLTAFPHTPVSAPKVFSGKTETVQGDSWCKNFSNCSYRYSLTRQGETTPCVDPGIRVVPPNPFAVYLWVVALVALASFVVFRIRARNRASSLR